MHTSVTITVHSGPFLPPSSCNPLHQGFRAVAPTRAVILVGQGEPMKKEAATD